MIRVFILCILACSSCAPKGPAPFVHQQTVDEVAAPEMKRTQHFQKLVGRGAIEFTWSDENGNHKEQGELDFWKQGNSVSLRVTKLGELLAWFGGEGKDFWFFDLMEDEPTLRIGGKQGMFNDIDVALVLLGLVPVPECNATVKDGVFRSIDKTSRTWSATYSIEDNRPLHISMRSGKHKAEATHIEGIRVEIDNLHELHWPITGGNIDIRDNQGNTEIKIVFSSLSTIVEDEPMERVFDLEFLKNALKPVHIMRGE